MEKKDVETVLKRIKYNYNEFRIDDYTMVEWYKELKDYSLEDVMNKLEQHFRSEQYGNSIPKVYFLTKYLKKEKEKSKLKEFMVRCQYCNELINNNEFDKHTDRCRSVNYLNRQSLKYTGKEINKEEMLSLEENDFNERYKRFLIAVSKNTENENEKKIISKILYNSDLEIGDIKII